MTFITVHIEELVASAAGFIHRPNFKMWLCSHKKEVKGKRRTRERKIKKYKLEKKIKLFTISLVGWRLYIKGLGEERGAAARPQYHTYTAVIRSVRLCTRRCHRFGAKTVTRLQPFVNRTWGETRSSLNTLSAKTRRKHSPVSAANRARSLESSLTNRKNGPHVAYMEASGSLRRASMSATMLAFSNFGL